MVIPFSSLEGKLALVTGGTRGIGKAIALTFAKAGADVATCNRSGGDGKLQAVAKEIQGMGRRCIAVEANVSHKNDVENMVHKVMDEFGKIDILVNNAGIFRRVSLLEMPEEDWDDVMEINAKGTFLCTQIVARHMIERKYGKIINIASIAGLGSSDTTKPSYSVSKAGIIQLTKTSALVLGPYNINVNAIAPGTIVTDFVNQGRTPAQVEQFLKMRAESAILNRVGTPEEVANLAYFLASDQSSFITGQVITIDGGKTGKI